MRVNRTFTVGADPLNVVTGTSAAPSASSPPEYATRVFAQMLTGGSGLGYVLDGVSVGRVPSIAVADDVTAELAAASATAPGGSYEDAAPGSGDELIDLRKFWLHGANAGDRIKFSFDRKI